MRRILCPQLPKANRPALLVESEAKHATQVLRLSDGDTVEAIDGQGQAIAAILRTLHGPVRLELPHTQETPLLARQSPQGSVLPVVLEMGILKGDAMEWVVEKCVELGVKTLIPVTTDHTVVQTKNKGPEAFQERWQKIADQALKQCGRLDRMEVQLPQRLSLVLKDAPQNAQRIRFFCDELTTDNPNTLIHACRSVLLREEYRILIGPEGGWSRAERDLLTKEASRINLSPLVLRAETAAIFSVSLLTASLRDAALLTTVAGS